MSAIPVRRGPAFGTFAPDEVAWLVDDLSAVDFETTIEERERVIAAGRHYAETLPVETAPSAVYDALVGRAFERSAATVARLVGRVTDAVLATHGRTAVLVSLARAGTPVGVLMRRWARRVRGVELPHYAMSVVRGQGPDRAALAALGAAHDPASLVFVDGWTGTGAVVDELGGADVVTLADPAHATTVYGTRADVLIPSACLTATVCGLVSRTVRHPDLRGADGYDGAKFYPGLADADRTATFLDAVTAWFPDRDAAPSSGVPSGVSPGVSPGVSSGVPPDRRGRAYVAALARDLGVDVDRVKPGLGETTRVLLRRAPRAVLLARDVGADAEHLRWLCRERGVPVGELPEHAGGVACPYRGVGLIRSP